MFFHIISFEIAKIELILRFCHYGQVLICKSFLGSWDILQHGIVAELALEA